MRRRNLLHTGFLLAAAALLPLAWTSGRQPAGMRRYGRHYLVNGWVLSARDLEAIRHRVS
jgi:hypothetical protein